MIRKTAIFVASLLAGIFSANAQINHGGVPPGFKKVNSFDNIKTITFSEPDIPEREKIQKSGFQPLQVAVSIPSDIDLANTATTLFTNKGTKLLRLSISVPGAKALGFYYSQFRIPDGGQLFIYNAKRSSYIGSFNSQTNKKGRSFATIPVPGDKIILEYVFTEQTNVLPEILINEVAYFYSINERGFGDSGPCEVNVNCPEGNNWRHEKNGIAKILLKQGGGTYLCTGSLVNNTNLDNTPYFYTANHCGETTTLNEYNQWVFIFNYQASTCPDPLIEPQYQSIVGSQLVAKSKNNGGQGSDFKLLLLNENVPEGYNPYFNGWSRSVNASPEGVGIHHPQGDIKKISTFTSPLVSTKYEGTTYDPEGKYWKVVWAETETNHGVTEGGSSGSPIFNHDRLIIGALTGGAASCQNLTGPDYYGKFSYSWESNGSYDSLQLRPWLDPENTGVTSLDGIGINTDVLVALFKTSSDTVAVGESVDFTDLSRGGPDTWEWVFDGGLPSNSLEQNPVVKYNGVGRYRVRLIVSNDQKTDTLDKPGLIWVRPKIGPNPVSNEVELFFGNTETGKIAVRIFNFQGGLVGEGHYNITGEGLKFNISYLRQGMYFLEIVQNNDVSVHKMMKVVNQE